MEDDGGSGTTSQFCGGRQPRREAVERLMPGVRDLRPTGYLWLARYRQQGLAGIAEHSRRPASIPDRTGAELEDQVVGLRQRYPDWGARGVALARSTIHRILLRHGLIRDEQRAGAAMQRFERKRADISVYRLGYR